MAEEENTESIPEELTKLDAPEEAQPQEPQPEEPEKPEPKPKRKPGRPAGAKDKKPRVKPKTVAVVEQPEYVEPEQAEEEEPQLERILPGSRPIPTEADARDHTARIMLAMLQQQAQDRQRRKTDLWKSWFR